MALLNVGFFHFVIALMFVILTTGCTMDAIVANLTSEPPADLTEPSEDIPVEPKGTFPIGKTKYPFVQPASMLFTPEGHLLVASAGEGAFTVQKYNVSDDTLIMGFGPSGYTDAEISTPEKIGLDPSGNIYVLEVGQNQFKVFSSTGTFIRKVGSSGAAAGQFNGAVDLSIDKNGLIYVAECTNDRIQVLNANGTFNKYIGTAGTGNGQLDCPTSVFIDENLNVFVGDHNNRRIQKFDSSGAYVLKFGSNGNGPGQFNSVTRVRVNSLGEIFVLDRTLKKINKFSGTGTFISSFTGDPANPITYPWDIYVDSSDNVYVSDALKVLITMMDKDGVFIKNYADYTATEKDIGKPTGLFVDSEDNIFVTQGVDTSTPQRVLKFDKYGVKQGSFGTNGTNDGEFTYAFASATDSQGRIYTTDAALYRVVKREADGTFISHFGSNGMGQGEFLAPGAIFIDKFDKVYVADANNPRIQIFDTAGTYLTEFGSSGPGQLGGPSAMFIDKDGYIFVADLSGFVFKFNSAGTFQFKFAAPQSYGIVVDAAGNIYVSDFFTNSIKKYDSGGNLVLIIGGPGQVVGKLSAPTGLGIDSKGNIFVTELYNRRVQKFSPLGIPLLE
ncbi:6-bladed beta-propeller [Bdellovibrio reynosensis]|uniref:6-bladed beta-propeller n=1 Tax=Bdellovibrio reynosensis TaxID=2835041 RepID=A0ABY4CCU9_9BACT|nr:6-bladed beta-propeller [Bdellovibrio reynosensis]UOF02772.1 6-bladed beta-propeller [Bdellovibrio reynosensis]